ncbi:hypothetical protein PM082_013035 [Marasmius tenuissimus]|nr:hypothetical protein PM082_013035 [Marasmius tenuissimus]
MCHYIIDGRMWACGHFEPLTSCHRDCQKRNCLFSSAHPFGCKSPSCIRTMQLPVTNPVRVFKVSSHAEKVWKLENPPFRRIGCHEAVGSPASLSLKHTAKL